MEKLDNWSSFLPELPADLIKKVPVRIAPNSLEIMKGRHLHKNEQGEVIETPAQMFWRVGRAIALEDYKYLGKSENRNSKSEKKAEKLKLVEKTAREFYEVMARQLFCPGSRVLYEAGNGRDATGQLSSCFVLPIEDSLEAIFQTLQEGAVVQKNNGGTGYNFSHIRPKGDVVGGTPNVAAGPVHFIKTFSQAFDQVLQGKKRGGGNMAILNIDHPDIIEFINLKGVDSSIRNFNISVGITDTFMQAVRDDTEYDLINPRTGKAVKKLRAREVFDLICEKAWECADPGIFFSDTVQNANPTKPLGVIECTNPCGEEPLRSYESCNLGSVVVSNHLKKSKEQGEKSKDGWEIDWEAMRKTIRTSTHFLENMIDSSHFPLEKINEQVALTRKLGLGIVGLGTMLYKMEIPYNSEEGVKLTREVQAFIQEEATKESERLAAQRGVFPGYKGSKWDEMGREVRNATMTSIAPTGTLSLVVNTSSGIEPYFALVYKKHSFYQDDGKEDKKALLFVNEIFEQYAKEHGFYSEDLMERIADNHGSLQGLDDVPEEAKKIFVTTHDISPEWHVRMQAAAQENVDAAVSKTINLPSDATVNEVRKAYILAWQLKCKGITIYRDGSKSGQVLETVKKEEPEKKSAPLPENTWTLSANAKHFLERRVLLKDTNGHVTETPDELWQRIASKIAAAEALYDKKKQSEWAAKFYQVMSRGEFYSGGTFIQAGLGDHAIMSKCLVLPIEDSITGIFDTLRTNIEVLKRGVGTGFNFSKIRSTYAKVNTTGEKAAGPVEYLRIFNRAQDSLKGRGGRMMGSMAILNVDHPDVEEFVVMKDSAAGVSNDMSHYNISVGVSDKFMKAVKNDEQWDLIDPHDKKVYKTIKARKFFEQIARHAWMSGDPGLFFLDHAAKGNTTPTLGTMDSTNPCGEQPLIPYETCNLGNIDVSKFVKDYPFAYKGDFRQVSIKDKLTNWVDWDRLAEVVRIGVRFLDDVIDVNLYPIKPIEEMTKKTRNIGLGIMGFADFLIKLGISYNEPDATEAAEKIMKHIQETAHAYSQELGKEKGNFPAFAESVWKTKRGQKYMRNTRTTTIAPTGSVSIVADCNPGIEPVFALGYRRKNSLGGAGEEQVVTDRLFEEIARARGFHSSALMDKIATGVSLEEIQNEFSIPQDVVEVFKTTHEIEPAQHVRIQGAFQKHVDSAVSKTINLPNHATWQDIARVYQLAWELQCKGITVFRDGSKDPALEVGVEGSSAQVVTPPVVPVMEAPHQRHANLAPRQRPDKVAGSTYEVKTEQGQLYITINDDDQGMAEVFLNIGKSGSFTAGYTEAIGRLISMSLRAGIDPKQIMKQLQGIRTSAPTLNKGMFIYSVPDAIAKVMKKHYEEMSAQKSLLPQAVVEQITPKEVPETIVEPAPSAPVVEEITVAETVTITEPTVEEPVAVVIETPVPEPVSAPAPASDLAQSMGKEFTKDNQHGGLLECPDCGGDLEYAEGCILCRECGYSKCG